MIVIMIMNEVVFWAVWISLENDFCDSLIHATQPFLGTFPKSSIVLCSLPLEDALLQLVIAWLPKGCPLKVRGCVMYQSEWLTLATGVSASAEKMGNW